MESLLEEILMATQHLKTRNAMESSGPASGSYRQLHTMSPFCRLPNSKMWNCIMTYDLAQTQDFDSAREVSNFLYELHVEHVHLVDQ